MCSVSSKWSIKKRKTAIFVASSRFFKMCRKRALKKLRISGIARISILQPLPAALVYPSAASSGSGLSFSHFQWLWSILQEPLPAALVYPSRTASGGSASAPEPIASSGLRRQIKGIYTKCLLKSGARSHQILLNLSACLAKPPLPSLKIQYGFV